MEVNELSKIMMEGRNQAGQIVRAWQHKDVKYHKASSLTQPVYVVTVSSGKFHPVVIETLDWKTAFRVYHSNLKKVMQNAT